ncbi:hypothetical protein [Salinibacterium sp. ZJ450]|uniref:hypothetical protein n=1 Tax=Salinibacterium sp. ZJ450 TaxID=2708338 RepID=UPI0014226C52|nr:hypothetical protein [Salinibacterium sp. ZJ450]
MTDESAVIVHTLEGVRERRDLRDLAAALREPGSHLLVVSDTNELPQDVTPLATAIRDAAVATCAVGHVEGSALIAYAVGRLRLAMAGTTFAWGAVPVVPGLAAVLASAGGAAGSRMSWGEVLSAQDLHAGLTHRIVDDLESARAALAADLAKSGGPDALALRLRSDVAAREANSWHASFAFDRHLTASTDSA